MNIVIATISLLLMLLASAANAAESAIFDVLKYGAKPNGDLAPALTSAWKEACEAGGTIVIAEETYKLSAVKLQGPCGGPVEIQLDATLQAPADANQLKGADGKASDGWIQFYRLQDFTLSGTGILDGQGASSWKKRTSSADSLFATSLRLDYITNGVVKGITSKDAKSFHINVLGCKKLTIEHVTISAPAESLNTDGIHIGRSSGITISDTTIGTGDDCISLGDGSQDVTIQGVKCGPGHGISIGSLGKYKNEEPVTQIKVLDCTMTDTTNGVRIKTWPASPSAGVASDITFKGITMNNVANPVIIDQGYCPYGQCKAQVPSQIAISNLNIEDITGTSSTPEAVQIICSKGTPCQNVKVSNIDLTYKGTAGTAKSVCKNVKPTVTGTQNPPVCQSD